MRKSILSVLTVIVTLIFLAGCATQTITSTRKSANSTFSVVSKRKGPIVSSHHFKNVAEGRLIDAEAEAKLAQAALTRAFAKNPQLFAGIKFKTFKNLMVGSGGQSAKEAFLDTRGLSEESKAKLEIYMRAFNKK